MLRSTTVIFAAAGLLLAALSLSVRAELRPMEESALGNVSGQAGLSIEIPHLRVNAYGPGSVDDPDTAKDESDGRRTQGFTFDYVTRGHDGSNETHYFADQVSLALDIFGAFKVDIEGDGKLVVGLPDRMNFVGDGFSAKDIHLNTTGTPAGGGKLLNETNIQGNFRTGGTVTFWGD
ncbi:hypothetical protein QQM79_09230 [Marinobacteraceae bacterium S3BR75-40.1]